MIDSGVFMDFWDYSSKDLVTYAWQHLKKGNLVRAIGYANKCIQLYEKEALEMQNSLKSFPKGTDEEIHKFWALNDVATAHYIKGRAYLDDGKSHRAKNEFKTIIKTMVATRLGNSSLNRLLWISHY